MTQPPANAASLAITPPLKTLALLRRERRRAYRYQCGLESSYDLVAQLEADRSLARVRNISASGISLVLVRRVEPDAVLNVELYNKGRRFYAQVPLRILYVLEHPEGDFLAGGAFVRELTHQEIQGLL
jgi:hypothetical protein